MICIDQEACNGCKSCIRDCISKNLDLVDGKAAIKQQDCLMCGHCVAVCPQNAVSIDNMDMTHVQPCSPWDDAIDAEKMLRAIKGRRSVRHFEARPVEREKLESIIEAGRCTPTAANRQEVRFAVITERLPEIKEYAYETLAEQAEMMLRQQDPSPRILHMSQGLRNMAIQHKEDPKQDRLLFNAPALIAVIADNEVDAGLAASNMEMVAFGLGLGVCYCGYFARAVNAGPKLRELFGLAEEEKVCTSLILGYPDRTVKYLRSTPHKPAQVLYL